MKQVMLVLKWLLSIYFIFVVNIFASEVSVDDNNAKKIIFEDSYKQQLTEVFKNSDLLFSNQKYKLVVQLMKSNFLKYKDFSIMNKWIDYDKALLNKFKKYETYRLIKFNPDTPIIDCHFCYEFDKSKIEHIINRINQNDNLSFLVKKTGLSIEDLKQLLQTINNNIDSKNLNTIITDFSFTIDGLIKDFKHENFQNIPFSNTLSYMVKKDVKNIEAIPFPSGWREIVWSDFFANNQKLLPNKFSKNINVDIYLIENLTNAPITKYIIKPKLNCKVIFDIPKYDSVEEFQKKLDAMNDLKFSITQREELIESIMEKTNDSSMLKKLTEISIIDKRLKEKAIKLRKNMISQHITNILYNTDLLLYFSNKKIWGHYRILLEKAAQSLAEIGLQDTIIQANNETKMYFKEVYSSINEIASKKEKEMLKVIQTLTTKLDEKKPWW